MFWRGYGNVIGNAPIYGSLISNSSGIWDMVQSYLNPAKSFIQDGLLLHASASNINSYPGTGTTWTDLSGNGNDLTIDVDVDYLTDPINHFSFTDNAGNYIYTGGVIGGLTDMTLELHMRIDTLYTQMPIASYAVGSGNSNSLLIYRLNANELQVYKETTTITTVSFPDTNYKTGQFIQFVFTRSGANIAFYVDGVLISTSSTYPPEAYATGGTLLFGQEQDSEVGGFNTAQDISADFSLVRVYNRALTLEEINANRRSLPGQQISSIRNGLALYLDTLEESSYPGSGTTWYDISGNSNDGTLVNGPVYKGDSFTFDGANDYVSVSQSATIPYAASARTLNLWFYTNSTSWANDVNTLFFYGSGVTRQSFGLDMSTYPNIQFFAWADDLTWATTYSQVGWKNLCITYDGATSVKIYENGVLTQTKTLGGVLNTTTSEINIGRYSSSYYDGRVSVCQLYNRVLSDSEVLQNYNDIKGRY